MTKIQRLKARAEHEASIASIVAKSFLMMVREDSTRFASGALRGLQRFLLL